MKECHLQLNLAKTELLIFPATPTLQQDFTIQLGSSTITPSASVRNLGVIFELTFKEYIAKTARSCRFGLHNIRKIRLLLTEHATQLLVQALVISRLDYCNALLAGLPSNTIKPLSLFPTFPFSISSSLSLSFSPSLASLYLFEQCLRLGVTSTSSVCLPLQDESHYVFPNCKSLWIKTSAK